MLIVVCLHVRVGDLGRLLEIFHDALDDQPASQIVDLARDLWVRVVAARGALVREEVIQDEIVDELPATLDVGQLAAGARRQALDLTGEIGRREAFAPVRGDHPRVALRYRRTGRRRRLLRGSIALAGDDRERKSEHRRPFRHGGEI